VFLFCFSSSCVPCVASLSGLSIFDCALVFSNVYSQFFRRTFYFKEKIQELGIKPKPVIIDAMLVKIAERNNLTLAQLHSSDQFNEVPFLICSLIFVICSLIN
jgi:hypothetical protein